jgi:hypothetical protein
MKSSDKMRAAETAAEFFKRRANGRSAGDLVRVLAKVPARPPEPGDELPEGWSKVPARADAKVGARKPARP